MMHNQALRLPLLLLWTISLIFTGCKLGPTHRVPCTVLPEDWISKDFASNEIAFDPNECLVFWWDIFHDPLLQSYLETLVRKNDDLRIAWAKVREAYYARKIAAARFYPYIDAEVNFQHLVPGIPFGFPSGTGTTTSTATTNPFDIEQKNFLAQFDALWEIDLFGRTQRQVESAFAAYGSEVASKNIVLVTILSEFGQTYCNVRGTQKQISLILQEADALKEKTELLSKRTARGLDSDITLLQAQEELNNVEAVIPQLYADMYAGIYRLSVLLGENPDALVAEMEPFTFLPNVPDRLTVGIPSDLLRRRPDIRQAERQLAQATADVGVAVADLFPRLTLSATVGYEKIQFEKLGWDGETWSYNPNLLAPIFHGGELRSKLKQKQMARRRASIQYEKTVRQALQETEEALVRLVKSKESEESYHKAYNNQQGINARQQDLLDKGLGNKTSLLDAKVQLIEAERAWIVQTLRSDIELIALTKALGGGWTCN